MTSIQSSQKAQAATAVRTFVVDPAHSSVSFAVKHLMVATVKGRFDDFTATLRIDESRPESAEVQASIRTASITTGVSFRDDDLRSPNFFDAALFPEIAFRSKAVRAAGDGRYALVGDLTLRGVTREVALDVEHAGEIRDPEGKRRHVLVAEAKLDRREFGLTWNQALETGGVLVGDVVRVTLDLQFVEA